MNNFVVIQNSVTNLATPNNPAKLQLLEGLLEAKAVSGHDLLSTAFMAAKNGALDVLELLLDYVFPLNASGSYFCAAELDKKNSKNRSPSHRSRDILEMAVIGGHLEVVKFLLQEEQWYQKEQGDNKPLFDKKIALVEAANRGDAEIVSVILSNARSRVDLLNPGDALCEAAYRGHAGVVQSLLEYKKIISRSDMNDACLCARAQGHLEAYECLLSAGARPVQSPQRAVGGNTCINNLGRPQALPLTPPNS